MNMTPFLKTKSEVLSNSSQVRRLSRLATVTLIGAVLGGCAGSQTKTSPDVVYQYQKQHSPALNLMLAAGTMIEGGEIIDAEIKRPEGSGQSAVDYQASAQSADNFYDAINIIDGGMVMSGLSAAPTGVSSGFHGGMMLLSLLDSPYKPSFVNTHMVAFMPTDLAPSAKDASDLLLSMIREAIAKSVPEGAKYEGFLHPWKPIFAGKTISYVGVLSGGECDKSNVEFPGPGDQPIHTGCELITSVNKNPEQRKAPDWLGSGDVYLFRPDLYKDSNTNSGFIGFFMKINPKNSDVASNMQIKSNLGDLSEEKLLLGMTKYLPAWFYVYIAPTKEDPVPKIYQQGKVLYFAKYVD